MSQEKTANLPERAFCFSKRHTLCWKKLCLVMCPPDALQMFCSALEIGKEIYDYKI
jgi:hypothetical protein